LKSVTVKCNESVIRDLTIYKNHVDTKCEVCQVLHAKVRKE